MKGKILMIDDDADFREATAKILKFRGYDVVSAANAREARLMLKKEKPDLIILDIMLPDYDGFSLCTEIKENTDFFAGAAKHAGAVGQQSADIQTPDLVFTAPGKAQQLFGQIGAALYIIFNVFQLFTLGVVGAHVKQQQRGIALDTH